MAASDATIDALAAALMARDGNDLSLAKAAQRALHLGDTVDHLRGLLPRMATLRQRGALLDLQAATDPDTMRERLYDHVLALAALVRSRDTCVAQLHRGGLTDAQVCELADLRPDQLQHVLDRVAARG